MTSKKNRDLIAATLAMEEQEARDAGTLGFMGRALCQATLPHSKQTGAEFVRKNGALTLSITAPSMIGLPYGSIPRLLLAWLTTEAVRTQSKEIELGDSMRGFMLDLGMHTGGSDIRRLKDQSERLFASRITAILEDKSAGRRDLRTFGVASGATLWWNPKIPDQRTIWGSTVTLTHEFFEEVTTSPVPVDMRALQALKKSPMALDTYVWLTYRLSYLKRETCIPWEALQLQFGADYGRMRDFKARFIEHLKAVALVYPQARMDVSPTGLHIKPSPPHIRKK